MTSWRWILLVALPWASGCATSPRLEPAPASASRAERVLAAGEAAYRRMEIQRAIVLLHQGIHLDRSALQARDMLARASFMVGCGPAPPPCAFLTPDPDPWSGLGTDLRRHVSVSWREAERLEAEGESAEAREYSRCAEGLARLLAQ